jgi:putative hemolysin
MDILLIFGLILLNGVFAMSEIAVVSSRKVRLQQALDRGSESARVALKLAHEPTRFLSTIQVGITLIGILAGAMGEESIAKRMEASLLEFDLLAPYAKPLAMALMVICITYISLIFGELVPKRLALLNPEGIARAVARPMDMLATAGRPLVALLSMSTEIVLKLMRAKAPEEAPIIEEEIHSLMKQGTEAGIMDEAEHFMVRNVLRLDDQRVGNIMTLRKEIVYVCSRNSLHENCRKIAASSHSRVPLVGENLDDVLGVLYAKDVLENVMRDEPVDLLTLVKPPLLVPRSATALQLLELFKQSKSHLAIVTDERGHTAGVVTVNDVMEAIVGDLPAEEQDHEPDFVMRADGSWLVSAQVDIASFKEHFDIKELSDEESGHYHTLGGLVMTTLGRLPRVADVLEIDDIELEVMDMDGNRVDKVLVSKLQPVIPLSPTLESESYYRD